jgi:hypothetical protein
MSSSEQLPKKVRKYYARLIKRKMDEMGIQNQLTLVPSGKKKAMWMVDKTGQLIMDNGKPKQQIVDIMIARNIYKNTVKTLLRAGTDAIDAFLNVPTQAVTQQNG